MQRRQDREGKAYSNQLGPILDPRPALRHLGQALLHVQAHAMRCSWELTYHTPTQPPTLTLQQQDMSFRISMATGQIHVLQIGQIHVLPHTALELSLPLQDRITHLTHTLNTGYTQLTCFLSSACWHSSVGQHGAGPARCRALHLFHARWIRASSLSFLTQQAMNSFIMKKCMYVCMYVCLCACAIHSTYS